MLHSKQWHYSLHRDFHNCYSTRRSPTGFFSSNSSSNPSSNSSSNSTRAHYTTIQRILHPEDKELFEYYITDSRNSTHRRQGDLLEIHPFVLHDIPGIPAAPVAPETFRTFQSFMTFQPFQAILQCSSISRESTPFQHFPIRMHILHILQFDWFPQKLHRVPVEHLQTFISKKGRCCDIGQIDIFFRIELFPLSSLSSDNTNCKNDIQLFHQLFDELSVYRDYH